MLFIKSGICCSGCLCLIYLKISFCLLTHTSAVIRVRRNTQMSACFWSWWSLVLLRFPTQDTLTEGHKLHAVAHQCTHSLNVCDSHVINTLWEIPLRSGSFCLVEKRQTSGFCGIIVRVKNELIRLSRRACLCSRLRYALFSY